MTYPDGSFDLITKALTLLVERHRVELAYPAGFWGAPTETLRKEITLARELLAERGHPVPAEPIDTADLDEVRQ